MRHRTEIAHVLGFGASWGGFYPLSDSVAETTPVHAPAAHTAPPLRGVRRHCTLARSRIGADVRSCGNGGVMNRSDLTSSVSARTSVPGADADRVVAEVFATIAEALARGEKVPIAGFGTGAKDRGGDPCRRSDRRPRPHQPMVPLPRYGQIPRPRSGRGPAHAELVLPKPGPGRPADGRTPAIPARLAARGNRHPGYPSGEHHGAHEPDPRLGRGLLA